MKHQRKKAGEKKTDDLVPDMNAQDLFVAAYIENHLNGTRAYMQLHPDCSYNAARALASELLANPNIRKKIDDKLKANQLSTNDILELLQKQSRGDIGELIDDDGFIDLKEAKKRKLTHLIKEIEIIEHIGKDGESTIRHKVKLHDPQNAIDKAIRLKGLYKDTLNVNDKKTIKVTIRKEE